MADPSPHGEAVDLEGDLDRVSAETRPGRRTGVDTSNDGGQSPSRIKTADYGRPGKIKGCRGN